MTTADVVEAEANVDGVWIDALDGPGPVCSSPDGTGHLSRGVDLVRRHTVLMVLLAVPPLMVDGERSTSTTSIVVVFAGQWEAEAAGGAMRTPGNWQNGCGRREQVIELVL